MKKGSRKFWLILVAVALLVIMGYQVLREVYIEDDKRLRIALRETVKEKYPERAEEIQARYGIKHANELNYRKTGNSRKVDVVLVHGLDEPGDYVDDYVALVDHLHGDLLGAAEWFERIRSGHVDDLALLALYVHQTFAERDRGSGVVRGDNVRTRQPREDGALAHVGVAHEQDAERSVGILIIIAG